MRASRQLTLAEVQRVEKRRLNEWARRSSVLPLRIGDSIMTCVALRRGQPEGLFPEALTIAVRDENGGEVVADYMLSRSSIVRRR